MNRWPVEFIDGLIGLNRWLGMNIGPVGVRDEEDHRYFKDGSWTTFHRLYDTIEVLFEF